MRDFYLYSITPCFIFFFRWYATRRDEVCRSCILRMPPLTPCDSRCDRERNSIHRFQLYRATKRRCRERWRGRRCVLFSLEPFECLIKQYIFSMFFIKTVSCLFYYKQFVLHLYRRNIFLTAGSIVPLGLWSPTALHVFIIFYGRGSS